MIKFFKKITQNIQYFFQEEIHQKQSNPIKRIGYSILRVLVDTGKGFIEDEGFEKASTLTFYSLLSLIPLLAIGFGVAQYLGFEQQFTEQIQKYFSSQPAVAEKIIQFSLSTLKYAKGELIAGLGILVLLWTVLRMIANIETYFNQFWKVKQGRTLWQQVKSYIPVILLMPMLLVASSSLIIFMSAQAILATQSIEVFHLFGPVITFLFQLLPYLLNWGLLSFLFIYLPNTKVSWKAGILAGFITGILYNFWQWIYITFQVNAASYGAIYGSFAAIPLFLIWLNYSWLLILLGSEFSYQIQLETGKKKKD